MKNVLRAIGATVLFAIAVFSMGCARQIVAPAPVVAAADPYLPIVRGLDVYSQALVDAKKSIDNLGATQIPDGAGVFRPVLSADEVANVTAVLRLLGQQETPILDLVAAHASKQVIAAKIAASMTDLATKLSPAQVGIKNPDSQLKYVVITNALNLALQIVTNAVNDLPAQEAAINGPTGSSRNYPNGLGACSAADRDGAEVVASCPGRREVFYASRAEGVLRFAGRGYAEQPGLAGAGHSAEAAVALRA